MSETKVWSHRVLLAYPRWVVGVVLYASMIGVLYPIRRVFEGVAYNIAFSSKYGDPALIVAVLIGATILKRGELLSHWMRDRDQDFSGIAIGSLVSFVWWYIASPAQWGDIYHLNVVVPTFIYLGWTLVPVIYKNGTRNEKRLAFLCVLVWA